MMIRQVFLELAVFYVAELAEGLLQGCVFNLLKGIADVLVELYLARTSSAFQEVENLSLTFRKLNGTVI